MGWSDERKGGEGKQRSQHSAWGDGSTPYRNFRNTPRHRGWNPKTDQGGFRRRWRAPWNEKGQQAIRPVDGHSLHLVQAARPLAQRQERVERTSSRCAVSTSYLYPCA